MHLGDGAQEMSAITLFAGGLNQPGQCLWHALTTLGVKFDPRYFLTFNFYALHCI